VLSVHFGHDVAMQLRYRYRCYSTPGQVQALMAKVITEAKRTPERARLIWLRKIGPSSALLTHAGPMCC
jgi:hypothetical protein